MNIEQSFSIENNNGNSWHALEREAVAHDLRSSLKVGLSSKEAEGRFQETGPNQLTETPPATFWQMLWEQFNSFIVILLLVATVISALLGDYIEAAVIAAIVILNTALGVIQERRAEQALTALRKLAAPEAYVIRDGHRQVISATQLVPGDIVLLETGNFVPADIRLFETINFRIDESALTGESVTVQKDASIVLVD